MTTEPSNRLISTARGRVSPPFKIHQTYRNFVSRTVKLKLVRSGGQGKLLRSHAPPPFHPA